MTLTGTEWLGLAAGTLTTLAFVPQVIKTWKSKHANDISLAMFLLFSTGVGLWIIYGLRIGSLPVIAANIVTLSLALIIVVLKLKYQRRS